MSTRTDSPRHLARVTLAALMAPALLLFVLDGMTGRPAVHAGAGLALVALLITSGQLLRVELGTAGDAAAETIGQLHDRLPVGQWVDLPEFGVRVFRGPVVRAPVFVVPPDERGSNNAE